MTGRPTRCGLNDEGNADNRLRRPQARGYRVQYGSDCTNVDYGKDVQEALGILIDPSRQRFSRFFLDGLYSPDGERE